MQNKFFNVSFKLFPKYETCTDRVIHVEYENGNTSDITLEGNAKEPTLKLENGTVLLKGSSAAVTLEGSPKSISTTQKFTGKKAEFEILVRKFVDPKQTCRALKSEAEKYSNVTYDSSIYGPKNEEGYDYHSLIFTFAKGGLDYMFVRVPDYNGGYTDIECTTAGLTTGAVVGTAIASLVVVGVTVSFIVYRYRKRNLLYAPTTPAVYTPPLV